RVSMMAELYGRAVWQSCAATERGSVDQPNRESPTQAALVRQGEHCAQQLRVVSHNAPDNAPNSASQTLPVVQRPESGACPACLAGDLAPSCSIAPVGGKVWIMPLAKPGVLHPPA